MEFKKSTNEITKDVYDTVCAFSNREGGHIFLGVNDKGVVLGVSPEAVDQIKREFVTTVNNANKLYPPMYLMPEEVRVDSDQVSIQLDVRNQDIDIFQRILTFCQAEKSKKEICEYMGYHNRTFFTRKYLSPLIQKGELRMTQFDKPNSRNQKYIAVKSEEK